MARIPKLLMPFLPVFGACLFSSCGYTGKGVADSAMSDSTGAEEEAPVPAMLPDTVLPSASAVRFVVDSKRDSLSGVLDVLEDLYAASPGALTFRGGPFRQADFGGRVLGRPDSIAIDWTFATDVDLTPTEYGVWGGGTGWTGQPLYVDWPDSCVVRFKETGNLTPFFSKREIIFGSLSGKIYFLNADNGKASRIPIEAGNPIKGTPSLDPTLNGNLYVGHGVPANSAFGALTVDLYSHKVTQTFDRDPKAWRGWGAYDSSPLRVGRFLFRPGENNTLYKFEVAPGKLTLHSELRYSVNGAAPGIESSMAVYLNYGYICDNHGNIIAINLNNLVPVWHYPLGDDIDASPLLQIEDGTAYLYVGCEIDRQGTGTANFVKLNALTGERIWINRLEGKRAEVNEKHFDGGYYASALPGTGDASDLIFSNCVRNLKNQNGEFVAIERKTGKIRYSIPLKHYAWSSPVGFLNERDEMFILTGDCAGFMYVIQAADGEIIARKKVGDNFESSPVVFGNSAVVGSRGKDVFRVSLLSKRGNEPTHTTREDNAEGKEGNGL